MAIVSGQTKRLEIPHESGESVVIRQLSWRQREEASDVQTDKALRRMKNVGPELLREFQKAGERPAANADPANTYDRATVLQSGIVSWSYSDKPKSEEIDGLDEVTVDWLFREIIAFSGPPMEEERKNVSPPSI